MPHVTASSFDKLCTVNDREHEEREREVSESVKLKTPDSSCIKAPNLAYLHRLLLSNLRPSTFILGSSDQPELAFPADIRLPEICA